MRRFTAAVLLIGLFVVLSSPALAVSPRKCTREVVDRPLQCIDTLLQMWSIQTAIEGYGMNHKVYPKAATMEELKPMLEGKYTRTLPTQDAWGTPFRYVVSADGQSYRLISAGSDRSFDETSWDASGLLTSSQEDAVVSSGASDREWTIQR